MKLSQLVEALDYTLVQGSLDTEVSTLVYDSRRAEKDSAFVALTGTVRDSHDYTPDVIAKGASVLFVEKKVEAPASVTVIRCEDNRLTLAITAAAYFGH